nr:cytochrome c oxidase subunit III [Pennella sp. (in: crustaceans)]
MSNYVCHPFHLVDESPWPLYSMLGAFFLTNGLVMMFLSNSIELMLNGLLMLVLVSVQWWWDVSTEGGYQGLHSVVVQQGLRMGMILFIVSEVLFFFSFFWAFFHSSLSPTLEIGLQWPPAGIQVFNPFEIPLLNTIILLSSGLSVTWAHHSLMEGEHDSMLVALLITVVMGLYFLGLQSLEYKEASFAISDSVYGSVFFVMTGFHGLHVMVGALFLLYMLVRGLKSQFSAKHHFGFEAAAWYWHFVDVVWLFLFITIYCWSKKTA